jgi:protein O-mannosyl-transferase
MPLTATNNLNQGAEGAAVAGRVSPAISLLVIVAAVLPYLASLRYGFVYDDDAQVLANAGIRSWHFVPAYFAKPISFFTGVASAHYYRPMFFLWLRLNYFLWGTHAWGWHLATLALHMLVSLLVLAMFREYFEDPKWAAAGALIFAVHPAHVETVAWVSGCTDALLGLSLLGSVYLWMRDCQASSPWWRSGSLACCALALLAKETAVILPLIIFFHALLGIPARGRLQEAGRSRLAAALREAAPYAGVTAAYVMVRLWVLRGMPESPPWISKAQAFLTMPWLALFYVSHLTWPLKLSIFYDLPAVSGASGLLFWAPLVLLGTILAGTWICYQRSGDKRIAVAGLWFLLPLVPVLYIPFFQQDDCVHDRYLYISVLAVSLLVGILSEFLSKPEVRLKVGALRLVIPVILAVCLVTVTVAQARPWENNLLLYINATRLAPRNAVARNNLANQYIARGRYQEAREMLNTLLEERPGMWLANYNYAFVNYRLGNLAIAEEYFRRAIRIDPSDADEHVYLGTTYFKEGRLPEAAEQVRQGIARKPDGTGFHIVLGIILVQQGNLTNAREEMQKELAYHSESAGALAQLRIIDGKLRTNTP